MPTTYTTTRPTHVPAQTLNQAKRDYKANGPRISTQQTRQIARGVELYERAERIREAEIRKKQNAKRKAAREERERESRRRMAIPSPSKQVKKVSASQGLLVGFVKVLGTTKTDGGKAAGHDMAGEPEETEDYMDDTLDEESLLEVFEDQNDGQQPAKMPCRPPEQSVRDGGLLQPTSPIVVTKASTSFTEKTDFVLAREIAWTQDIEAARSFDAARRASPAQVATTRTPDTVNAMGEELWDEFDVSVTQLDREFMKNSPAILYGEALTPVAKMHMHELSRPAAQLPEPVTYNETSMASMSRTIEEEAFLAMLSTQDLNFSSPSSERQKETTAMESLSGAVKSPSLSLSPLDDFDVELDFDAMLMPPPPLPRLALGQPHATARPADKIMPPSLKPASAMMPPPPRPPQIMARVQPSLGAMKPVPKGISRGGADPKPSGQPERPSIARPSVEWVPFDFDLSTQDCREIGFG